ncbi:MAG TPA: serine hydrolase [Candidatus Polarisedimenticolia bacterium]|nr:serine hydrolase [Candidatus Polarisedimenticolia bacterium]
MRLALPIRLTLFAALALYCPSGVFAQGVAAWESAARADVEKLIRQSGARASVAFRSLDGAHELFIEADEQFEDTTALKIPVMIELYAEAEARELRWSDSLDVHATFRSVVDGSPYSLDPVSDRGVSASRGKMMTLRQLCDAMIARDSDLAANLLIEKLGVGRIRQRIHALGADGMEFVSGFGDSKAAASGLKNVTSARALMLVLWALAKDQVVSADASRRMLGLIAQSGLQQEISGATPSRASAPRRVAGGNHHDATIIIGARSFVLVTDVRGLADSRASAALVARIAHALSAAM